MPKTKKKGTSLKLPKNIVRQIPYVSVVRDADILETSPGHFAKTYRVDDSGFSAGDSLDTAFEGFEYLINHVDDKADFQFTYRNKDKDLEKYLTYSVIGTNIEEVKQHFSTIESNFTQIASEKGLHVSLHALSIPEWLGILFDVYHYGENKSLTDKLHGQEFSQKALSHAHLTTKDLVGSESFGSAPNFLRTEKGYIRVFFIDSFADHLTSGFVNTFSKVKGDSIFSVHFEPVEPKPICDAISAEIDAMAQKNKEKKKVHTAQQTGAKTKKEKKEKEPIVNIEDIRMKESYLSLFTKAAEKGEKVFRISFYIAVFASTLDELDEKTEKLQTPGTLFFYKIRSLDYQQMKGLEAVFPLASDRLSVKRTFDTKSAALFFPFSLSGMKLPLEEVDECEDPAKIYPIKEKFEKPKDTQKYKVKKTIQETIPYMAAYADNGIFETIPGEYSRMYRFSDINYNTATEEDQSNFLQKYAQLLNRIDSSLRCQIVISNENVDMREFKKDNLLPMKHDDLDVFRKEYNAIVLSKMEEGRNNLKKERYFVISTDAENVEAARHAFSRLDPEIISSFKEIGGSTAEPMTTPERLEVMYNIFNLGHEGTFLAERTEGDRTIKSTDLKALYRMGVSSKDLIAPSGLKFNNSFFRMGDKFCEALYLTELPNTLSDKFMADLTATNCNMIVSMNLETVRQDKAVKAVRHQIVNVNSGIQKAQMQASKNGYSMDLLPEDLRQAQDEARNLLTDLTGRNQKMFLMTFTILVYGNDMDELHQNVEIIRSTGRKYLCNIKPLRSMQEEGLDATLPLCHTTLNTKRTLTTYSTIIFTPFDTQELIQSKGMYYGQNATSHNLIIFNRDSSQNGNGWILGTPGCVDCETEFFNGREWKSLADYQNGDLVLQFDPETNEAALVKPERYIKTPCDKMYHFETKYGIDQTLSPEHRVLYYARDTHHGGVHPEPYVISAQELAEKQNSGKFRGKFKTDFYYDGEGIEFSDLEIKIMLAVIADGHFNKNNPKSLNCSFNFKKARKKNELHKLLKEYAGTDFRVYETDDGYTHYSCHVPVREKAFLPYWYNCNQHQLQVVCDNILQWDGRVDKKGRMVFSTSDKASADFVQFAFSSCGYRAVILTQDRSGETYLTNGKEYIRKSVEYTVTICNKTMIGMEWHVDGRETNPTLEEVSPSDGYKYCFTVPTHALVLRRHGKIFITGNSGKSFAAKREMANVFLNTDDDILIIDPEREYSPLVKAFGGSIVRIAPGSKYHLNPLDMDKNYADDDDPIVLKSDFMLSLCESVIGGRYGLTPSQIAIIDRCVNLIYKKFENEYNYDKRYTPTLLDFEHVLKAQNEREARELALAFEIYTEGSLNTFAFQSNVDIDNRFVVYDIKDIGSNIKTMAYLIVLDAIWNRVVANRRKGKKTWIYIDEIYILFEKEESTNFIRQIFSRCRKWGGKITGITQNVEPILQNTTATTMLSNSAFIMLLNQAPVDRDILAGLLKISPTQVSFINNAPPGQGILYIQGQGIIPFRDHFDKHIAPKLYQAMTSKPDELAEEFR